MSSRILVALMNLHHFKRHALSVEARPHAPNSRGKSVWSIERKTDRIVAMPEMLRS